MADFRGEPRPLERPPPIHRPTRFGPGPYLRRLSLPDGHGPRRGFPFSVPAVQAVASLDLSAAVTFLAGANGVGKSTLVEGIAVAAGFAPEGGSLTRDFERDTAPRRDALGDVLRVEAGPWRPRAGFFLRAESFSSVAARADAEGLYSASVGFHEQSHGESFLALALDRFGADGLYVLDEPEAALSVTSALAFLEVVGRAAAAGSQFVIATHSPVLLALPGARIYEVDEAGVAPVDYDDVEAVRLTRAFLDAPERFLRHLDLGG